MQVESSLAKNKAKLATNIPMNKRTKMAPKSMSNEKSITALQ